MNASRQLIIFRHGKAARDLPVDDFDRPLKQRGERDARRMGAWIQSEIGRPDRVLASPAKRAIDTARLACDEMGYDVRAIDTDPRLYLAGLAGLLRVIAETPDSSERLLLVGHNPGLEDLTSFLGDGQVQIGEDGKLLTTAAIAAFEIDGGWSNLRVGGGKLLSLSRPKLLE